MKTILQFGKIFLGLAILFLIAGCGVWQELHFTKNKPKESDLIGAYEPDAKTKKLILKDGGYPFANCKIKVDANSKIEFTNMPDWWQGGFGESHKQLISTNGTWNLEKVEDCWQIVWSDNKTFDFNLHLMGQKSPYKIFIYIGDPDSDIFMIFERTTSQ
ncbi:MAG TPA: hypothetical protein VHG71_02590 [Verrucomicrobiae bacterium]|nr:hypothetical protein [Verrucomicrobiae bacterium]